MAGSSPSAARSDSGARRLRIAAAGDLHCGEGEGERVRISRALVEIAERCDLILLCGDLTGAGRPEEAAVLAQACRGLRVPILAVLGNHDWDCDRTDELARVLEPGGVRVLERSTWIGQAAGVEVGVVGLKGFVGGYGADNLVDIGEPLLREVYRETSLDVEALDRGLREIARCTARVVLLHYSPTVTTIKGEREGIWPFLGTDRLAAPIAEHAPDLVVHGHAHAGNFEGAIGSVGVYNVARPVIGRDFWVFDVGADPAPGRENR